MSSAKTLLQFFALGALLFAAKGLWPPATETIVISAADVGRLRSEWARETRRAPAAFELDAQIRALADEELLVREALRLGLDRSDPVVGGRLARNMRFVGASGDHASLVAQATALGMAASDVVARRRLVQAMHERFASGIELTDADVRNYVQRNAERYGGELRVSFRQRLAGEATQPLLPAQMTTASEQGIARVFGAEFAQAVLATEPGRWSVPVRSAYGMHQVYVSARAPAAPPDYATVRRPAYYALLQEREREAAESALRDLRARYRVTVEPDALAMAGAS